MIIKFINLKKIYFMNIETKKEEQIFLIEKNIDGTYPRFFTEENQVRIIDDVHT